MRKTILQAFFLIIIFNLFYLNKVAAQTFTDMNKKDILTILPKENNRFTYSLGGTKANFTWVVKKWNENDYVLNPDVNAYNNASGQAKENYITSKDNSMFFLSASVSNINEKYFSFLTAYNQPLIELSGSFALNSVKWVNWDKLRLFNGKFFKQWDFYVKGYVSNGFSNYFDTANKVLNKPSTLPLLNSGVQADFIGYQKRYWIVFIANIFHGMPTDNLESYQDKIIPALSSANPTVVPLGKSAGKYGPELNKNQWNGRVNISIPLFLADKANSESRANNLISKTVLLPVYGLYGGFQNQWTHVFGASLGILKKGYNSNSHDAIIIKPMLQLGINWQTDNKTKNGISAPGWIISFKGTF